MSNPAMRLLRWPLDLARKLYHAVVDLSAHPAALPLLALISLTESIFFPIPPDAMLIPMCVARPRRALLYAGVCLGASILGAGIGYWLGATAMDTIGARIVALYGLQAKLEQMFLWYQDWDAWIVMIAGFTPIPYKLITLSAGAANVDLGVFFLASIVSRGARFFLVAGLLMIWGERAAHFIERHFDTLTLVFAALLIGVALLSLH